MDQAGFRLVEDLERRSSQRVGLSSLIRPGKTGGERDHRVGYYDVPDFWEAIPRPKFGRLILEPDGFYLLASKRPVRVPADRAAEMMPYDPAMGEFRVHYAGFFDPGFGYGTQGEIQGTRAVLEDRAHEIPILLEDDQLVGRLNYYKMAGIPDKIYGLTIGSSYQQQGLALSKQFKRPA